MTYASATDLYEEILTQVDDGRPDNALKIALDALKAARRDETSDSISPIVDVRLNPELSGQFGGDRVEVLLDVWTSKSLTDALALLQAKKLRVVIQSNGDRIRSDATNQLPVTDRLMFFYEGPSCILTLYKHIRHNIIVIQLNRRDYKK